MVGYPCKFINDFAAIGYYLTKERLAEAYHVLHKPAQELKGERTSVYLGAGTGLGFGYLYKTTVFSSEGGHIRFAPESPFELEFFDFCKRQTKSLKHMSVERAVSGPGIKCLYDFVVGTNKLVMDVINADPEMEKNLKPLFKANELKQRFVPMTDVSPDADISAIVSKKALAGDPQCLALMALFFAWYGRYTADAAVTFCPKTIYLTGGII